jgi:hypothetical protein
MPSSKASAAPYVRKPWERVRCYTPIVGESRTHQSHKQSCDINHIIRKYDNTGLLPDGRGPGQYADVTHLQEEQLDTMITRSRETLDQAGRELTEKQKAAAAAEKERVANLEREIADLKKAQAAKKDPPETP